jgi:hypothetical protein
MKIPFARSVKALCSVLVLAGASVANAQWSASGTVASVYSHDGYYFVSIDIANNPCGTPGKFWWPTTGDTDAKDMYAMALTALAADKPIAVVFDENAPNCYINGARVTHMVISR